VIRANHLLLTHLCVVEFQQQTWSMGESALRPVRGAQYSVVSSGVTLAGYCKHANHCACVISLAHDGLFIEVILRQNTSEISGTLSFNKYIFRTRALESSLPQHSIDLHSAARGATLLEEHPARGVAQGSLRGNFRQPTPVFSTPLPTAAASVVRSCSKTWAPDSSRMCLPETLAYVL
jgi:hypothetical protein